MCVYGAFPEILLHLHIKPDCGTLYEYVYIYMHIYIYVYLHILRTLRSQAPGNMVFRLRVDTLGCCPPYTNSPEQGLKCPPPVIITLEAC